MPQDRPLPRGQIATDHLQRFGLDRFANRFPQQTDEAAIAIGGDVRNPLNITRIMESLSRKDQISDFHCVTTWSVCGVNWGGISFSDFYHELVVKQAKPRPDISYVVLGAQDGYKVGLPLEDLLAADVMLADQLDGLALPVAHGAPLRLVAPSHYGYKSIKHLSKIEFFCEEVDYPRAAYRFMDHPRARVQFEERGRFVPGWLLRWLYRPLIKRTQRKFAAALARHSGSDH